MEQGDQQKKLPNEAKLCWSTEIPVKIMVPNCNDKDRKKLDETLRDLQGVYDVGITKTPNAMVTVTGYAHSRTILETVRTIFIHAEPWSRTDE